MQPGEYWLIEQAGEELSSLDRSALGGADIVIYDPPLAALVAQVLPIGRYAEPLSDNGEPQPAVSPRALRFAGEGWRVAQLLEARRGDNQRLHDAVEALIQLRADDLPLLAIAKRTVDGQQLWDGRLHDLPELIDKFAADDPLTLILDRSSRDVPRRPTLFRQRSRRLRPRHEHDRTPLKARSGQAAEPPIARSYLPAISLTRRVPFDKEAMRCSNSTASTKATTATAPPN